jgi:hypothetical protein
MRAAFARNTNRFLLPCVQEQIAWAISLKATHLA